MSSQNGSPRISVVVISLNEGSELEATVSNLTETLPQGSELIVVDDGSTDGSTEFLRQRPDVRVIRSHQEGVARARNLGGRHAMGDVIVFSDAHVRAPKGWTDEVLRALSDPAVGAVAPGVYSVSDPECRGFGLKIGGPEMNLEWMRKQDAEPYTVPVLPGCFLALKREVFEATSGYDPGMKRLGGNDCEISFHIWLLGYELKVLPQIEVSHLFRTVPPYEATWAAVVHNRLRMAMVHFGPERIEQVVHALRPYRAFPTGMAMLIDSDLFERRRSRQLARVRPDDWFFNRFEVQW